VLVSVDVFSVLSLLYGSPNSSHSFHFNDCSPSPPRGDMWDCVLERGQNAGVCPRSTRAKEDVGLAFSSSAGPVVSLSLSALIASIGVGASMVLN